jgi:hypothetical protein
MNWDIFGSGNSIGKIGSEDGIILDDIENIKGARITIEKGGANAPLLAPSGKPITRILPVQYIRIA